MVKKLEFWWGLVASLIMLINNLSSIFINHLVNRGSPFFLFFSISIPLIAIFGTFLLEKKPRIGAMIIGLCSVFNLFVLFLFIDGVFYSLDGLPSFLIRIFTIVTFDFFSAPPLICSIFLLVLSFRILITKNPVPVNEKSKVEIKQVEKKIIPGIKEIKGDDPEKNQKTQILIQVTFYLTLFFSIGIFLFCQFFLGFCGMFGGGPTKECIFETNVLNNSLLLHLSLMVIGFFTIKKNPRVGGLILIGGVFSGGGMALLTSVPMYTPVYFLLLSILFFYGIYSIIKKEIEIPKDTISDKKSKNIFEKIVKHWPVLLLLFVLIISPVILDGIYKDYKKTINNYQNGIQENSNKPNQKTQNSVYSYSFTKYEAITFCGLTEEQIATEDMIKDEYNKCVYAYDTSTNESCKSKCIENCDYDKRFRNVTFGGFFFTQFPKGPSCTCNCSSDISTEAEILYIDSDAPFYCNTIKGFNLQETLKVTRNDTVNRCISEFSMNISNEEGCKTLCSDKCSKIRFKFGSSTVENFMNQQSCNCECIKS